MLLFTTRTGSESEPVTCSFEFGALLPMPTLQLFPRTTVLLAVTVAPCPSAVALVMPATPFAWSPMNVLLLSVVLLRPLR